LIIGSQSLAHHTGFEQSNYENRILEKELK
jgi:hypothetical protein